MTYNRGDVILVRFPHSDLVQYKKRPALIVQGDDLNTGLTQKIVAMITSNIKRTGATRVMVKTDEPNGLAMKLPMDSVVVTDNLATILEREIDKTIGHCPDMTQIDNALKQTLGIA
jgi:mRNA interferase MazF